MRAKNIRNLFGVQRFNVVLMRLLDLMTLIISLNLLVDPRRTSNYFT